METRPVPKPRQRTVVKDSQYENVEIKKPPHHYDNYKLDLEKPVPAQRKPVSYENPAYKDTGAIRKVIVESNTQEKKQPNDDTVPRTSVKSASKLLIGAITDTCTENIKTAHNKLDKKFNKISGNVRAGLSTLSLKRKSKKDESNLSMSTSMDSETLNTTDDAFTNISFESPLKTDSQFNYEIPKSLQSLNLSLNEGGSNDNLLRNTAITRSLNNKMDLAFKTSSTSLSNEEEKHIYGKINKNKKSNRLDEVDSHVRWSNTATAQSDNTSMDSMSNISIDQNDLIKYLDEGDDMESGSENEPLYANESDFRSKNELDFKQRQSNVKSLTKEILSEFDPLNERTMDDWMLNNTNHFHILETLLSEETYGMVDVDPDSVSIASVPPSLPQRVDSLPQPTTKAPEYLPKVPPRTKQNQPDSQRNQKHQSVIIHQNLKLPGSVENLADESAVDDYMAKVDNDPNINLRPVDLSYPKTSKTSWFVDNMENDLNNPVKDENPNHSMVSRTKGLLMQTYKKFSKLHPSKTNKFDPNASNEMIPKPPYGDYCIQQKGTLFKLPSGVFEDIMKELSPRICELKDRVFSTYLDQDQKQLKEQINLCNIASIQCITKHKFSNESREIHAFELNVSNPLATQKKFQNVTYVYGIHTKNEKYLWMTRIFRSLTNIFPKLDFTRAGWCYMKKFINSEFIGTWIMLHKRRLYYYNEMESNFVTLDLRKVRCISLKESSEESYDKLLVEKGPMILLDCPPAPCIRLVMATPRETKIWSILIKDESHKIGSMLKQQQLTKDNVPVIVDKCVNFIYAYGSMSEGIFRKPGSQTNVQKLLDLFNKDAFDVQITRSEYSEHDVASALKKFFRQLPDPLMGKLVVNFISVSEVNDKKEKIPLYRDLLNQIGVIEYGTLKKLLGHLHFVQNLQEFNKMGIENLSMVWGPTLLQNDNADYNYQESNLIADLIILYKNLFDLTSEELKKETIMTTVLKKYHLSAENLSNSVKHSGDLKVWIFLDPNPEESKTQENKIQCNVSLGPTTKVIDVCKELARKINLEAHHVVMIEFLLEGELSRPLYHDELLLNVVLQWTNYGEDDRKNNYLEIRPIKKDYFISKVQQTMKMQAMLSPQPQLYFADRRTKSAKLFAIDLSDGKIYIRKKDKVVEVVKEFGMKQIQIYAGIEKRRESNANILWGLTLIDKSDLKRTRSVPYLGHIICGNNKNDQIIWLANLLQAEYGKFFPE